MSEQPIKSVVATRVLAERVDALCQGGVVRLLTLDPNVEHEVAVNLTTLEATAVPVCDRK